MFKPKFTITLKILSNITKIVAAREVILNAYLVPKWEVSLRRDALLKSTHSSTSIEGNPLSLEEVSKLAAGREVMATRKAKQEVLNYLDILQNISKFSKEGAISEDSILKMHFALTKETLDNLNDCGVYRNRQVVVGDRFGDVIFRPPDTKEVPHLMKEFVEWLNSRDAQEFDPVLEAGIAHYEFVRIHPFIDGNGRTARSLATLILYLREFDVKRFFTLDDYYDADRSAYYKALQSVNQETLDLTKWLEYFTDGVAASVLKVKERILQLSSEKLRKNAHGQIALTERQMKIIEHTHLHGKITSKDLQNMFKISPQATHKEIIKLVKLDVLKPIGKGRGAHYILK